MSRNSSGTYTLPAGNPVVTGTTITSTWGNTTMSDIANALTDSLSRSGLGSMTAGLRLFDGTSSLPGLTWGTELTSGMYRAGAGDYRWVITTTELLQLTTNLAQLSGTAPVFRMNESDAAANNRLWDVIVSGENLAFRVLTDALVPTNWMLVTRTAGVVDDISFAATNLISSAAVSFTFSGAPATPTLLMSSTEPYIVLNETDGAVDNRRWYWKVGGEAMEFGLLNDANSVSTAWLAVNRTGTTVDTTNFSTGTLQYGGIEVGYRDLAIISTSGNRTFLNTDRGKAVEYGGAGGHTLTVPAAGVVADGGLITVLNSGTGTCTVNVTAGSLVWFNGSGALATGARTLAIGAWATLRVFSSGSTYISGTGIS